MCTHVHTFVYLFICVCARTCTHVPTFAMLHIWRSMGQLIELVFSFYSGLQESNSSHRAKAGASQSQRTTCGSQGSHSEHQVGSKLPYLLSNLTTSPWVNISWRLDVALWYKHEPNQVSSSRGHGSRYAQGLDETERDMHSLYCLELGMLGKDYSSRRAASSIWVCFIFSCFVEMGFHVVQAGLELPSSWEWLTSWFSCRSFHVLELEVRTTIQWLELSLVEEFARRK